MGEVKQASCSDGIAIGKFPASTVLSSVSVVPTPIVVIQLLLQPFGKPALAAGHARNAGTDRRNKSRHPGVVSLLTLGDNHHHRESASVLVRIEEAVLRRYSFWKIFGVNIHQNGCRAAARRPYRCARELFSMEMATSP